MIGLILILPVSAILDENVDGRRRAFVVVRRRRKLGGVAVPS
jgi:hypothetical protein